MPKRRSRARDVGYATFSVGVSGDKERTTFFPGVVFGKQGEAVAKYVTKGREARVSGRIRVNESGSPVLMSSE